MLGLWRSHEDYQSFVISELSTFALINPGALFERGREISKLYILDLDILKDVISPLYSNTGRPSELQPEIFRSCILMQALDCPPDSWIRTLQNNLLLRTICGFSDKIPSLASHYDFINRIMSFDDKPRHKKRKRKPKKKLAKGEKLPPKRPAIVDRLVKKIIAGRSFDNRPELVLQQIFAQVSVMQSVKLGLIPQTLSVSGDGTCLLTGASPYGVKTCECRKNGIYNCDCPRRFSDPNATWGWDSHKEQWFYGYTGYFISTYNKAEKLDLPLYLRLVSASRHDSVSAVVALCEFRELYPDLSIDCFIHDSAADNYATYELLDHWGINPVIALNATNKGNTKYPQACVDDNGTPICPAGNEMVYYGYCGDDRCRLKWRCPRVMGKVEPCEACKHCSPSDYGRVVYTKPEWDLRLFTKIPRGSGLWKAKMKERTAAERVNNRILNHYGIEKSNTRGKKRISFFTTIAGINIHLDAQLAKLKKDNLFDFAALFNISQAA